MYGTSLMHTFYTEKVIPRYTEILEQFLQLAQSGFRTHNKIWIDDVNNYNNLRKAAKCVGIQVYHYHEPSTEEEDLMRSMQQYMKY